jgi:hypothetical protein
MGMPIGTGKIVGLAHYKHPFPHATVKKQLRRAKINFVLDGHYPVRDRMLVGFKTNRSDTKSYRDKMK